MSFDKNKLKNSIINLLSSIFRWFVPPWFWVYRWLKDQVFLVNLRSQNLSPGFHAYPLWLIFSGFQLIKMGWGIAYRDYGMQRYSKWIGEHYGPMGRGYFNYGELSDQEKIDLYGVPRGRLEYILNNNSQILAYGDGQSFLDAGCGRGQNIKVLSEYYPNSTIRAFDISEGALSVVKLGIQNQKKIHVEVGSLTDINYLDQYSSNGFDHVLISHVFSLIMKEGEENSRKLRQNIIENLLRISKKSLLIIDSPAILKMGESEFEIEQLHRATYKESVIPYFNEHLDQGEVYAIFSSESLGVLFKHNYDNSI
jgi:ubiquinone/menaquinone biosynthesis C-methylase UbiE